RPNFRMNAGVYYQSRSAPDLITEHAEAVVWRLVHPHFLTKLFTIKRPTFPVSGNVVESPELRLVLVLERDRNLEGVSGRGLVQGQRGQIVEWAMRQIVCVQEINARAATARSIKGRQIGRDGFDGEAHSRQIAKVLRRFAVEYFRNPGGTIEQILRCFGVELRIVPEELHECRKLT